ncbi:NrfD/PsrC family molybdoenzyme membrane anchor subunit [Herbaspirillum sp. ST 5-3]|uniref:NrfD/PsrC family molybdoenzyme membrane anchor subunit n=1 Tax=Oxalobacteraceae TaxID=75682 RepID=UPI001B3B6E72|nr:NrfD/PsrC family molybdoenzyme membrane anchor subunit [Herbaspirillum sp. ST 5-3]
MIREPKDFGEAFRALGDLWRSEGTMRFLWICLNLGKQPSAAGRWWFASLLALAVSFGFAMYQLIFVGHASFNTSSNGVVWGLPIASYAFFVLTSSGLTMIASLATVFGFTQFYPIAKRCIWIAIITLIAGFSQLILELGHPFRLLWAVPTGLQVMSPMFWMGVFYSIDLCLLLVEFYLLWRKDWDSPLSHMVARLGFIAVILASGMLGLVFGSMAMRPMWYGSFTSIFFMLTAALSGAAAIVLTTYMAYGFDRNKMPARLKEMASGRDLPMLFATLIGLTLVMILTRFWTGLWSNLDGLEGFKALVKNPLFHIEVWLCFGVPFLLMISRSMQRDPSKQILAAALVLAGLFINRYEFIIGGQMVPMFKGTWAFSVAPYVPSVTEWALAVVGIGIALALYALGETLFELSDTHPESEMLPEGKMVHS